MSSSLTLRQRQPPRKLAAGAVDDEQGPSIDTGRTPSSLRSSPPQQGSSSFSFGGSPPISPATTTTTSTPATTRTPSPIAALKAHLLPSFAASARRRISKPPSDSTHNCKRGPSRFALRSGALWILLLLITSCLILYNALPPSTSSLFPRSILSTPGWSSSLRRSATTAKSFYNNKDATTNAFSVVFHPHSPPVSSLGLCVPANAYTASQHILTEHHLHPHLGGLYIDPLPTTTASSSSSSSPSNWRRVIRSSDDRRTYHKDRGKELRKMDVFPDGIGRRYEDDFEYSQNHQCRRNNWRSRQYPNCNAAHELFTLDRITVGETIEYKGHGAFRNTWLFSSGVNPDDEFVLKSLRLKSSLQFSYDTMYQIHKEAIVMERLSASPRIVDIYGFCGTTVLAEHMSRLITGDIVWGSEDWEGYSGWMKQSELDKLQKHDVHPMNNLTNDQKLDMAIVMAESIADIHGFEGGVIVHGDIHPIQWLQNPKGQVKLNDFNNGEILDFYPEDNDYCKIYRCYGGTYRSPEEFRCMDSNEAMDTYSMGNNIYILLVGLWPFYQYNPDDSRTVQKKLIDNSEKPYVDPRYRNRSDIEAGLVRIMEVCWEWDLEKRAPIFEIVRQLYELRDRVRGQKSKALASS